MICNSSSDAKTDVRLRPFMYADKPITSDAVVTFTQEGVYAKGCLVSKKISAENITDVEIHGPAIKVTFTDGDVQKVAVREGDQFSFEQGIVWCIARHACGGSNVFKVIKACDKIYAAKEKAKEKEIADKAALAKKIAKNKAVRAKHAARKRAEQVAIQKEAFIAAMSEIGGTITKA